MVGHISLEVLVDSDDEVVGIVGPCLDFDEIIDTGDHLSFVTDGCELVQGLAEFTFDMRSDLADKRVDCLVSGLLITNSTTNRHFECTIGLLVQCEPETYFVVAATDDSESAGLGAAGAVSH